VPIYLEYLGYSVEVPHGETVVGRDVSCALRFNGDSVSRRHMKLVRAGDEVLAEDLGSTNGTRLNGKILMARTSLKEGDAIELGGYLLELRVVDPAKDQRASRKMTTLGELGNMRRPGRQSSPTTPPALANVRSLRPTLRTAASERRRDVRRQIEIPIVYSSAELEIEVMTRDLSLSGVFVRSDVLDPVGTACELEILIDGGPPIHVRGMVRRVVEYEQKGKEPVGLGIEFLELGAVERQWIESAIEQLAESMEATLVERLGE
jgi:pSer/pThr/pTyr-binding forkhead associated (FHA) protein